MYINIIYMYTVYLPYIYVYTHTYIYTLLIWYALPGGLALATVSSPGCGVPY